MPLSSVRNRPFDSRIHQDSPEDDSVESAAAIAIVADASSCWLIVQAHTSPPRSHRERYPGFAGLMALTNLREHNCVPAILPAKAVNGLSESTSREVE